MFRILVVDDTKTVHAFVKLLLKSTPEVEQLSALDGVEALEFFKSGKTVDLVLLDWEMPRMTGPQCLTEIKKLGVTVPIVMMTTKNSPDDIAHVLELGASEYILKPFTVDILLEKIESVTGQVLSHAG